MKKLLSIALKVLLTSGLLLLTGCQNTVQAMLEDYNSQYTCVYEKDASDQPVPGDPDFVEEDMLFTEYYVSSVDTLNLSAPKSSSYKWTVYDPDENVPDGGTPTEIEVVMFEGRDRISREFVTYIPESTLKSGKTYKLKLVVTDDNGKEYSDVAGLVIYKHYEF